MWLAFDRLRALDGAADCIQIGGDHSLDGPASTDPRESGPPNRVRIAHAETGALLVLLAGQLHDRESLGPDAPGNGDDIDDAQLTLAAYRDRPTDFAKVLIGEFALILWDERRRCLLSVRDALGVVPLYYHLSKRRCVVATRLGELLDHPDVPRNPNLGMLAEHLAFDIRSRTETLYTDVLRIPPGHILRVTPEGVTLSAYWSLADRPATRFRDPRDYVQRFGELLDQAVSARLSGMQRVGVSLSGGLDSSTIAAVSVRCARHQPHGPGVVSYSLTFPGQPWDEREHIAPVVDALGLPNRQLPWTGFENPGWWHPSDRTGDLPSFPTLVHLATLFRAARAEGIDVLLTGEGGDLWHDGSAYPHLDLIANGNWRVLGEVLADDSRKRGPIAALRPLLLGLLWPLAPGAVRLAHDRRHRTLPDYLNQDFCDQVNLVERLRPATPGGCFSHPGQWQIASVGLGGTLVYFYEHLAQVADRCGIALSHPLMDRRLVEFGFTVPEAVKRRGDTNRLLIRQAMKGALPSPTLSRLSKASFGGMLQAALLMPEVRRTLESPQILEHEWIAAEQTRAYVSSVYAACDRGEPTRLRELQRLWMIFACHIWMRSR